jgi:deoxyribodipyrimidine photo-lyase
MLQLKQTGLMSNRGRQIAASCLVNELQLDWRYGASYFESQLLDYDVASNWGNWQYIAGVGVDPRGGRWFDIDKQSKQHDPDGLFISAWLGSEPGNQGELDSVDAADWPIQQHSN